MPRVCTICTHTERETIDKALVGGGNIREMSALYRVSEDALSRHKAAHLPAALVKAHEQEDVRQALDVVKQLRAINGATMQILAEARQRRDPDVALRAIDRIQRQIELQAKLLGDLDERPVVNVLVSPEWVRVRTALLDTLRPYPDALTVVTERLWVLGAGAG